MTEQEVMQIITKDTQAINDAPFPEPLPDWLLDNFKKVIMGTPQNHCRYFADTVRKIASKKPNQLTVYEGGFVINLLVDTTPENISKNFDDFLNKKGILELTIKRYDSFMKHEERKLEAKKANLLKMCQKRILTAQ